MGVKVRKFQYILTLTLEAPIADMNGLPIFVFCLVFFTILVHESKRVKIEGIKVK